MSMPPLLLLLQFIYCKIGHYIINQKPHQNHNKLPSKLTHITSKPKPQIQPNQTEVYKKDRSISNLTQPPRCQHHTATNNLSKPWLQWPTTYTVVPAWSLRVLAGVEQPKYLIFLSLSISRSLFLPFSLSFFLLVCYVNFSPLVFSWFAIFYSWIFYLIFFKLRNK